MSDDEQKAVLPSSAPDVAGEVAAGAAEPILIRMPVDVRGLTLSLLALLAAVVMLKYAQAVLIPIVLGILLSYVLAPGVDSLHRRGVPRIIGSTLMIALLCVGIGFGVYKLSGQVMDIVDTIPKAARRITERLDRRPRGADGPLEKVQEAAREVEQAAEAASEPATVGKGVTRVQVVQPAFAVRDYLWAGGVGLLGAATQFAMVLFLVFFLLVTGDLFKRKLVKIAGPTLTKKKITVQIMDEMNKQIGRFLRVQVITSAIVGVATALVLWWFGVNQYLVWGLLAGVFNSIPYLGPVIVSGGLAVVSFMQFDNVLTTGYVTFATLAITSLEGWLLAPALMGRAAQMNPVAIFVGLLFWSWVWGVMGTILAVPMMMMMKAVCDRVEDLQPVGELLGD
jgi:predicted PurR-regulated permease PerM